MPERLGIHRESRQRRLVFEIVERSRNHPTAQQVFDVARREAPAISLGTVYRNLRQLADEGRIQENKIGGEPARFEVPHRKHYHIWCVECGRLEDLTLPYQDSLDRKAQRLVRYRLQEHRMEFFGVCPECRRRARPRVGVARQGRTSARRTADRLGTGN
ncbi:MAG: Fur family transcriptional regulator [Terriglobia bacterium]